MMRVVVVLTTLALASACTDNTAPGNDREAALDPPARAAEVMAAGAALQGVATGLVMPQIMTDADLGAVPATGRRCVYRMTRVGLPVLVYGSAGGVVKLNDKLVPLEAAGDGRFAADGVTVTVRPLEDDAGTTPDGELFEAELVLRLPGAPNELGFHGFAGC
jgi:hypothetical protein